MGPEAIHSKSPPARMPSLPLFAAGGGPIQCEADTLARPENPVLANTLGMCPAWTVWRMQAEFMENP